MGDQEAKDTADGWNIRMPDPIEKKATAPPQKEATPSPEANGSGKIQLTQELSGWGMEVPGVIGGKSDDEVVLPGVIGSASVAQPESVAKQEETREIEEKLELETNSQGEVTETQFALPGVGDDSTPEDGLLEEIETKDSPEEFWAIDGDENKEKAPPGDEALAQRVRELLMPSIEKMVKEYCQKNVEKVAWEVIPDLAENLIKKEIHHISESNTEAPSDT